MGEERGTWRGEGREKDLLEVIIPHGTSVELQLSPELDVGSSIVLHVNLSGVQVGVRVHPNHLLPEYRVSPEEMRLTAKHRDVGVLDYSEVDESIVLPVTPAGVGVVVERREKGRGVQYVAPRLQPLVFHLLLLREIK